MKSYGLNSVRLPVGWWYWAKDAGVPNEVYTVPAQDTTDLNHPITKFIKVFLKFYILLFNIAF
jgi:aryl-phospho-beta-D-glucosidase BglC (GH1 family)